MIKAKSAARTVAILALCSAILFAQQVALAVVPNVELVTILVIVFTLTFKYKVLYIIYVFAFLEGLVFGFSPWWWIPYLYVWTLLAGITWVFRKCESLVIWAAIAGVFGLVFGALCSIPHLFIGGPSLALAYWVSGIPFDIVHCVANFAIALVLWKPLMKLMSRLHLDI